MSDEAAEQYPRPLTTRTDANENLLTAKGRLRPQANVRYALEHWIVEALKVAPPGAVWVEIGAGVGTGISCMSRHLIDAGRDDVTLISVDPFAGTARCGEQTRVHGRAGPHTDWTTFLETMERTAPEELRRIHIWRMTSLQAARAIDTPPDLVVIDGAHDYASVSEDISAWDTALASPGALIFDDMVEGSDVERAVLERFPEEMVERRGNRGSTGFQVDWPSCRVRR